MKVMKTFLLVVALSLWTAAPPLVSQQKPSAAKVKQIQDIINQIKKAKKQGKEDKVKELKKKAIQLTDKYYEIPQDNVDGEPTYDPKLDSEGKSSKTDKKVKVKIGESAFSPPPKQENATPGWLASVKIHEILGHGSQAAADNWYTDPKGTAIQEIEAYDAELKKAKKTGLTQKEIDEIKKRRKEWYDTLSEENKKKIDRGIYTLALAPASERSRVALAGRSTVFVAGTVAAEEVTLVSVRGPRTLEGLVVSAEVEGRKAEARTDEQGRALIDLVPLAADLATTTVATIRVLDAAGQEISQGRTTIEPGTPGVLSRPQVPALPEYVRSGDVVTVTGRNLGAEAQLVVGDRLQETLAASGQELTSFVDAPGTGPLPVYVVSPVGESDSQTVHFYRFDVKLTRNTIRRGERIVAVADYAGLPPGTEIAFTNASPGVVRMKALAEARTVGNTSVVKISQPSGSVQVELLGKTAGGFVINYEIRFPEEDPH